MNIIRLILLTLCATPVLNLKAQSNNICDTKLFKQLQAVEKGKYKRPNVNPNKALRHLMTEYEVLCPLQVEKDFNGDNRTDWVGVLEQQGQFFLIAYMSGKNQHSLSKTKQYKSKPNNLFFDVYTQKRLYEVAGMVGFQQGVKFAAVENILGGKSTAYVWRGKSMGKLAEFKLATKP